MTSLSLHLWLFAEAVLAFLLFSSSFNWFPSLHAVPLNKRDPSWISCRRSLWWHVLLDHSAVRSGLEPQFDLLPGVSGWKVAGWTPALSSCSHLHLSISLCHACVSVFRAEMGPVVVVGGTAEAADFRQRCPLVCFPVCRPDWLSSTPTVCHGAFRY